MTDRNTVLCNRDGDFLERLALGDALARYALDPEIFERSIAGEGRHVLPDSTFLIFDPSEEEPLAPIEEPNGYEPELRGRARRSRLATTAYGSTSAGRMI